MSKITKRELLRRLEALEEWSKGADDMLTELNHALPDPEYGAKCEAAAADVEASLDRHRERLGLNKSQLTGSDLTRKMLDDGATEIDCYVDDESDSEAVSGRLRVTVTGYSDGWFHTNSKSLASWRYAVPVTKTKELTGSDLCRKMLARGDSRVVCLVGNISDNQAVDYREHTLLIEGFAILSGFWDSRGTDYKHAVPVSPATNEPLTAAEVGL